MAKGWPCRRSDPAIARLSARIRHPQLTGFKTWAVAHLLVNGDVASFVLFGGLLAWAVVAVILINLDGTENKGRLGANAILGVSLATAKAAADWWFAAPAV